MHLSRNNNQLQTSVKHLNFFLLSKRLTVHSVEKLGNHV